MLFQGSSRGCGNALPYDKRNLKPSKFEKNVDKGTDTFCVSTKSLKNIFSRLLDNNQKLLQPCSRAARKWRENEEMNRKWRENEEIERKWKENEEMDRE